MHDIQILSYLLQMPMEEKPGNNTIFIIFYCNSTACYSNSSRKPNGIGETVYLYALPVIFIVGVCGNTLSLRVFLSASMRSLSATVYLAVLSLSDLFVLFTFGAMKWLDISLQSITGSTSAHLLGHYGVCQLYEYVVQVSRFISAWCVVVFTVGKRILYGQIFEYC